MSAGGEGGGGGGESGLLSVRGRWNSSGGCFTEVVVEGELVVVPDLQGELGSQFGLGLIQTPEVFLHTHTHTRTHQTHAHTCSQRGFYILASSCETASDPASPLC